MMPIRSILTRYKTDKALPIRVVLVVPFLLQIIGTVSVVGYLSFKNGQQTVKKLAVQLEKEVGARVDQHLQQYLTTPAQINQINQDAIDLGFLDPNSVKDFEPYFARQIRVLNLSYINYGTVTGQFVGIAKDETGQLKLNLFNQSSQNQLYEYEINAKGERGQQTAIIDANPLSDPWYTDAVKAGQPIWSQIYQWQGQEEVSISYSYPIYDRQKKLLGVLGTDLKLIHISRFLENLKISPSGRTFILERNGLIVASSDQRSPMISVHGKLERRSAKASEDPLIRATTEYLYQTFGELSAIQTSRQITVNIAGQRTFVQVNPWKDQYGLNWLVVVAVPESDFTAQISANTNITIVLCITALVVTIILGIYTARWLSRPIRDLKRASWSIADGDLAQTIKPSWIHELNAVGLSFNHMAAQLQTSFTQLETSNSQLEARSEELSQKNCQLETTLTELHQTQAQMIQAEKMSALGQMLAGIAHEINAPIHFVHGNLEYADRYFQDLLALIETYDQCIPQPPLPVQQKIESIDLPFITQDLTKIIRSMQMGTDRIQEIVMSLRNFSRFDQTEYQLANLHEGIENTLLILRHRLQALGGRPAIQVVKNYGDLPLVECYAGLLNQVFMNLLGNAVDALEEKMVSVRDSLDSNPNDYRSVISIVTEVIDNESVRITVSDNADGISEAVKAKLFETFFTTKAIGKGTGLGLSISRQIIVEKHHGRLFCQSTLGEGTQFHIEIPIRQTSLTASQSLIASEP